jgi:hypothetical protein
VSQPVLPMLPARARSIGASAGLLEGPDGGVVFVFGLATFNYGACDEAGPAVGCGPAREVEDRHVARCGSYSVKGVPSTHCSSSRSYEPGPRSNEANSVNDKPPISTLTQPEKA